LPVFYSIRCLNKTFMSSPDLLGNYANCVSEILSYKIF